MSVCVAIYYAKLLYVVLVFDDVICDAYIALYMIYV